MPHSPLDSAVRMVHGWANLRVDIKTVGELVEWLNSDSMREGSLIAAYNVAQAQVRNEITNAIDWRDRDNETLVLIAETYYTTKRAIRDFLPEPFDSLTIEEKFQIFIAYFLCRGLSLLPDCPLFFAISNTLFIQIGPGAVKEIGARFQKNVGATGGALSYLASSQSSDIPDVEGLIDKALRILARSSLNAASKKYGRDFRERIMTLGMDELKSQIRLTWFKQFNHGSPVEALARSLDGKYSNPIGTAVADDIFDRFKSEQAKFESNIIPQSQLKQTTDDVEEITITLEDYPDTITNESIKRRTIDKVLAEFAIEHPSAAKDILAMLNGERQKDQAAAKNSTERTIRNQLTAAKALFADWLLKRKGITSIEDFNL